MAFDGIEFLNIIGVHRPLSAVGGSFILNSKLKNWFRPAVLKMKGYAPGEQPKNLSTIKLNTNENPYPPSAVVLKAVRQSADKRLRLYPEPAADTLRQRLA